MKFLKVGVESNNTRKEKEMLSKEEYTPIELREHCIKTMQFSDKNSNAYKEHELILSIMDENISMKYELDQLESDRQKLIEINNKYLQKLVYALTPTKHALGDDYNNAFKKIIAENIDLETCKIKRKLKECWGIDKKF